MRVVLQKSSAASLKLYAKLIDLLDMVVDVDILSGTSAGGINAALLASSRVNGFDLGGLRDLWLDLGALLISSETRRIRARRPSCTATNACSPYWQISFPILTPGRSRSKAFPENARTRSTTLYVTTTLLTAETSRFADSFGTLVQDVDRRGLFTFSETDLAKENIALALALAARSSASFPLAFEPSFVPVPGRGSHRLGTCRSASNGGFRQYHSPTLGRRNGLLDNQPIDVLLKRIFDRPAQRSVRRVLLFVVPSSDEHPDLLEEVPPDRRSMSRWACRRHSSKKASLAITTQSIAADLRALRAHQDRMEARTDAKLRLAKELDEQS